MGLSAREDIRYVNVRYGVSWSMWINIRKVWKQKQVVRVSKPECPEMFSTHGEETWKKSHQSIINFRV